MFKSKDKQPKPYEPLTKTERVLNAAVGAGFLALGTSLLMKTGVNAYTHYQELTQGFSTFRAPDTHRSDALLQGSASIFSFMRAYRHFGAVEDDFNYRKAIQPAPVAPVADETPAPELVSTT